MDNEQIKIAIAQLSIASDSLILAVRAIRKSGLDFSVFINIMEEAVVDVLELRNELYNIDDGEKC